MAIKVVLHRILLKRDIPEDTDAVKTKKELDRLGLAVPAKVQEDIELKALRENASMDKGTVVSIGETAFKDYGIDCPIQVGDYITFAKFGGKEVTDPETGEVFVVINDEDVVALLTK
jgi:co-chaperonin GroES (HSP10)